MRRSLSVGVVTAILAVGVTTSPAAAACDAPVPGVATSTVYLPNVTKTLGGIPTSARGPASHGWSTPFIVQNSGSATATLEVSFYRFADGECVTRRLVTGLAPGRSFAHSPYDDPALPDNTQFSVIVRSFGSAAVGLVNQHKDADDIFGRSEAMAYGGFNAGATTVYLPNVVRRFGADGPHAWVSPFVMQNLGAQTTVATARFVSFDGSSTQTVTRTIAPGRSQVIDPNSEPGLRDGTQYAVAITSPEPIAVVENLHSDVYLGPFPESAPAPVAYSVNGITGGASTVYGPYAAKNANGVGRVSTIVVQNVGSAPVRPSLTFTAIAGTIPAEPIPAPTQTFLTPAEIPAGGSWAFDPRFALGTTTPCSEPSDQRPVTVANATCLRDGEYSFVATAAGPIAAVVNVISPATAMGYTALARPDTTYLLPNVTKTLGGREGWTTPILLQAVTASGATLRFYRVSDGALATTHTIAPLRIARGTAARIDPRDLFELADDTQYSVVVEGMGGTIAAIVIQLDGGTSPIHPGGIHYRTNADNAMIYEGFPAGTTP